MIPPSDDRGPSGEDVRLFLSHGAGAAQGGYVDDAVHAFALSVDAGSGKLLNVGTGLETSVNHLYRMLAEATGFGGEPTYGPLPTGDLRRSSLDPSLAERELGWKPWTQLGEGLRATVEWLRG